MLMLHRVGIEAVEQVIARVVEVDVVVEVEPEEAVEPSAVEVGVAGVEGSVRTKVVLHPRRLQTHLQRRTLDSRSQRHC